MALRLLFSLTDKQNLVQTIKMLQGKIMRPGLDQSHDRPKQGVISQ